MHVLMSSSPCLHKYGCVHKIDSCTFYIHFLIADDVDDAGGGDAVIGGAAGGLDFTPMTEFVRQVGMFNAIYLRPHTHTHTHIQKQLYHLYCRP